MRFWPHEPFPFEAEREAANIRAEEQQPGGLLGTYSPSESKGAGTREKRATADS